MRHIIQVYAMDGGLLTNLDGLSHWWSGDKVLPLEMQRITYNLIAASRAGLHSYVTCHTSGHASNPQATGCLDEVCAGLQETCLLYTSPSPRDS